MKTNQLHLCVITIDKELFMLSVKSFLTLILLVSFVSFGLTQNEVIRLNNPSFEDTPKRGGDSNAGGIKDWFDCGRINFAGESPPDIHPNGFWENNLPSSDGDTYLGMVTRDNGSYESVSQRLDSVLEAGQCYKFTIHLAKAEKYISHSRVSNQPSNYTTPIVLRIWGGSGFCNEKELLAESAPVNNTSWQINTFEFRPKNNIRSITFSAYYKTPTLYPYNGNILVDGGSDIVRIPCPGEQDIAANVAKLPPHKRKKNKIPTSQNSSNDISINAPKINKSFKPSILKELDKSIVKVGQIIEIKKLLFKADSATIDRSSYEVLDELYDFLMASDEVIVEIGGHTNGVPSEEYCNKLSTARAKSVAEYLVSRGVDPTKVQFKGYGKKKPIADNKTKYGRDKNQRVEIKILSLNS